MFLGDYFIIFRVSGQKKEINSACADNYRPLCGLEVRACDTLVLTRGYISNIHLVKPQSGHDWLFARIWGMVVLKHSFPALVS